MYSIYAGSSSDGKVYHMLICPCGRQGTAGICEHIQSPIVIEQYPQQVVLTPTVPHCIGR